MFYDNIYKICRDKGTSPTVILKELGYSTGNVSKWKSGSVPNIEWLLPSLVNSECHLII